MAFIKLVALFASIIFCYCFDWDYGNGTYGPENWKKYFPHCGGLQQSPVAIWLEDLTISNKESNENLITLTDYDKPIDNAVIFNNGDAVQINVSRDGLTKRLSTALLKDEYHLRQLHFHWSSEDETKRSIGGSEHTIGLSHYPLELHLVHFNNNLPDKDMLNHPTGITVLAVFYTVDDTSVNEPMQLISESLEEIFKPGEQNTLAKPLNLTALLPEKVNSLVHYFGSLTTPPCSEVVNWLILTEPAKLTTDQLRKFHAMLGDGSNSLRHSGDRLERNYRPTQPLNRRKLHFWTSSQLIRNSAFPCYFYNNLLEFIILYSVFVLIR